MLAHWVKVWVFMRVDAHRVCAAAGEDAGGCTQVHLLLLLLLLSGGVLSCGGGGGSGSLWIEIGVMIMVLLLIEVVRVRPGA
jgi:hypothetical protein